jgi:hypothetical protein
MFRQPSSSRLVLPTTVVTLGVALLSILLPTLVYAQSPVSAPESKNRKVENPAILRWKILLASLAQEARTVFPEERRAYAIVEVANASWVVDRETTRQLYRTALDNAVAMRRQDAKHGRLVTYVMKSATRLDVSLAQELAKRLVDDETANEHSPASTALDVLEENPEAAARIAEAIAPSGLEDGTAAFLIFRLAAKDLRLSDRVYSTYLNRAGTRQDISLAGILNLAGYGLGRGEYYSVTQRGELSGATFRPIAGFSGRPAYAGPFLRIAYQRLAQAIDRRDRAVGAELDTLNYAILFASDYLIADVAKFQPSALSEWQQLQQRGVVGATTVQTQAVRAHMQQISQARLRIQQYTDDSQTPESDAEASLETVEKLAGTCQRDAVYSNAALLFSSRKDFKRALEIVGEIEDLKQAAIVKEAILIAMTEAAIEGGDFETASSQVEKVVSLDHRARLYVMLVGRLVAKRTGDAARAAIDSATKVIDKVEDADDRAAFRFALASAVVTFDELESRTMLTSAIRELNKAKPRDEVPFSIPIRVPLSCPGEETSWYGGFESLPNSGVLEAVDVLATANHDETLRAAEEIGDKVTRIRAVARIAHHALKNLLADSKRVRKQDSN